MSKKQGKFPKQKAADYFKQGLQYFSKYIELRPNNEAGYLGRGFIFLHNLNQYQKAADDFLKAIKLNPNNARTQMDLAETYEHLGQWQKAIDARSIVIKLAPKEYPKSYLYLDRAETYIGSNQYEKAVSDLSTAIKLDPKSGDLLFKRAELYNKLGKPQLAAQDKKLGDRLKHIELWGK